MVTLIPILNSISSTNLKEAISPLVILHKKETTHRSLTRSSRSPWEGRTLLISRHGLHSHICHAFNIARAHQHWDSRAFHNNTATWTQKVTAVLAHRADFRWFPPSYFCRPPPPGPGAGAAPGVSVDPALSGGGAEHLAHAELWGGGEAGVAERCCPGVRAGSQGEARRPQGPRLLPGLWAPAPGLAQAPGSSSPCSVAWAHTTAGEMPQVLGGLGL